MDMVRKVLYLKICIPLQSLCMGALLHHAMSVMKLLGHIYDVCIIIGQHAMEGTVAGKIPQSQRNFALDKIKEKQINAKSLITDGVPLIHSPEVCEKLIQHPDQALGVILLP